MTAPTTRDGDAHSRDGHPPDVREMHGFPLELSFEAVKHGAADPGLRALIAPLGLIGVTELVGNAATASIRTLVKPVGSIISIALGVLGGVSIYRPRGDASVGRAGRAR